MPALANEAFVLGSLGLEMMSPSIMTHGPGYISIVSIRRKAIRWILEITVRSTISAQARDAAIDVLDRFLFHTLIHKPHLAVDERYISFAAASALILASKLHEGKSLVTIGHFPHFDSTDLAEFEAMVLKSIGFKILAVTTPSNFSEKLLDLWSGSLGEKERLKSIADTILRNFHLEIQSTVFAPFTLAIASLRQAFSLEKIDCSSWLLAIPDFQKLSNEHWPRAWVVAAKNADECLAMIQRSLSISPHLHLSPIPLRSPHKLSSGSPTSVTYTAANTYGDSYTPPVKFHGETNERECEFNLNSKRKCRRTLANSPPCGSGSQDSIDIALMEAN